MVRRLGEIVAEIRIVGPRVSRTVRAVVDMGATNTVIDEGIAEELGVRATEADEVGLGERRDPAKSASAARRSKFPA